MPTLNIDICTTQTISCFTVKKKIINKNVYIEDSVGLPIILSNTIINM